MKEKFKILALVLLFSSLSEQCHSTVSKPVEIETTTKIDSTLKLPVPGNLFIRLVDPNHITVKWRQQVKASDDNPILGIKVKLWEDEKKNVTKYILKDRERVAVQEVVAIKRSPDALPTHEPAFEAKLPPDALEASFDVKLGEPYEVRAQTYNSEGDGPITYAYGFRISTEEEEKIGKENKEDPLSTSYGFIRTVDEEARYRKNTSEEPKPGTITVQIIYSEVEDYIEQLRYDQAVQEAFQRSQSESSA